VVVMRGGRVPRGGADIGWHGAVGGGERVIWWLSGWSVSDAVSIGGAAASWMYTDSCQ
jgi:hypothetical protein